MINFELDLDEGGKSLMTSYYLLLSQFNAVYGKEYDHAQIAFFTDNIETKNVSFQCASIIFL